MGVHRYLPGIQLPSNIVACPDLLETCRDATMLVFVVPHQVNIVTKVLDQSPLAINTQKKRDF